MKRPILVTGFRPFAGHPANPSELVARSFQGRSVGGHRIRAAVLPVVYREIESEIDRLLAEVKPAAVICLGLDYKTDVLKLERIAINCDDAAIPDETGELRMGTRIADRGPAARWSSLPLELIAKRLEAAGIPHRFSTHAGAYLCNHLMYHVAGRTAKSGVPSGFIHLPPTPDLIQPGERNLRNGAPLAQLTGATRVIVGAVAASIA